MRRITVEEVLEAYRVKSLTPVRGLVIGRVNPCQACAAGALYAANVGPDRAQAADWFRNTYGGSYAFGFFMGFDGKTPDVRLLVGEAQDGYADGQAVAAAVFQEQGAK